MPGLKGKTVLVTGGAKRLGREIALMMAHAGADVAITFKSSEKQARETLAELLNCGIKAIAIPCDVRDESSVSSALGQVKQRMHGLDVLINNAAAYETVDFQKITLEQWDNAFATNVRGPFAISQAALLMLKERHGRIINIGSLGGVQSWASHAHYCVSKSALHALTRVMAKALAPEISVNCVAPGMIEYPDSKDEILMKNLAAKTPMRRNVSPAEVASVVLFFAEGPKSVTGQTLVIDGGLELA